jgi:hypothetical protein
VGDFNLLIYHIHVYLFIIIGRLFDVIENKHAMEWTEDKEDILIDLWRKYPCLYYVGNKSYSKRNEKQKALNEMSEKLSITPFNITKHLSSLRTQYTRLVKPSPSGSEYVTKTARQKWLVDKLEFLRIHVKKRDSLSNLDEGVRICLFMNICLIYRPFIDDWSLHNVSQATIKPK